MEAPWTGWRRSRTSNTVNLDDGRANPKAQKKRLAEQITHAVMDVLNYGDESVSVAFQEMNHERNSALRPA